MILADREASNSNLALFLDLWCLLQVLVLTMSAKNARLLVFVVDMSVESRGSECESDSGENRAHSIDPAPALQELGRFFIGFAIFGVDDGVVERDQCEFGEREDGSLYEGSSDESFLSES